jgi:hypothetical protein
MTSALTVSHPIEHDLSSAIKNTINTFALTKACASENLTQIAEQLTWALSQPPEGTDLESRVIPMGRYAMAMPFVDDEVDILIVCNRMEKEEAVVGLLSNSPAFQYLDPKEDGHRFLARQMKVPGSFIPVAQLRIRILCLPQHIYDKSSPLPPSSPLWFDN